ncbi:MAG TPA: CBS domain-containing protein [Pirellulaceae bacterium]|nr:CBS domain-containing protein [Pirellulaceae bacterium]
MYQVKDAMCGKVVSILPEASVEDAIHTLLNNKISGAPVIDAAGRLCGIISQFQLLEIMYDPQIRTQSVKQFMTRDVVTVEESAFLGTAANLLVLHRIHRLPVVNGGRVVGIISRSDLLKYFVATGEEIEAFFDTLKSAGANAAEPCGVR